MHLLIQEHHITQLRSLLPYLQFILPNDPEYPAAISRWNPANQRKPGIIAFPLTTQDVSYLVRFAHDNLLEIAVKGGGMGNRGSSTDGGLCIDLSGMRTVTVYPASKRVAADGGALWSDVYAQLDEHDLAVVGGISPAVGVGGLSLHGGHGWLTGAHGLALDQFLELEVVLADGNIIRTSDTQEPDLFWALRGAGSAFGVVTQFVLRAFEQPNSVWTGRLVLANPTENINAVIKTANNILSEQEKGQSAMCWGWTVPRPETGPVIWVVPFYNGSEEEAKEFFAPLLNLGKSLIVNSTKAVPFSASASDGGGSSGEGLRKLGHGSAVMAPLDPAFFRGLYQDYATFMSRVPDAGKRTMIMFEIHNTKATTRLAQDATAYPNRGNQVNVQFVVTWAEKENDVACEEWCRQFTKKMIDDFQRRRDESTVDDVTKDSVGLYSNYNGNFPHPPRISQKLKDTDVSTGFGLGAKDLFGVNYDRLVDLKKKYDSENLFYKFFDILE
ncbi:hypothetical protein UA08_00470 [Talaromyces atroroseus]|uniref:FAD-binding PCMH-type domain-containing protein n=1 Tax=Talaromyces atroroseus TaxID=1441469 RepID=A0A225B2H0_TALAT|nr:hypothetical protein UA08_00470 [Talaromyces atroroseus]OKL63918.1 hypothetical protein UA08_00470 [Talaromyces atroroseus]